jgi:hypothetical protein
VNTQPPIRVSSALLGPLDTLSLYGEIFACGRLVHGRLCERGITKQNSLRRNGLYFLFYILSLRPALSFTPVNATNPVTGSNALCKFSCHPELHRAYRPGTFSSWVID